MTCMKNPSIQKWTLGALFLLPLLLATPEKAFGYVDPGSGAFVYQAAYAVFLGGAFYFRKIVGRLFKRNSK